MSGKVFRSARVVAALLASLALAACGGGGGGGDPDPVTCTALSFNRALVSPSSGDVYFEQSITSCSTIDVSVLISNLTGIWTVGFDMTYPSSLIDFQSFTTGPLLLKGSPLNTPVVVVTPSTGVVDVAMSRLGSDPPVSASGSEVLITFRFVRVASGAGAIDFKSGAGSSERVLDDSGIARPAVFAPGHGGIVTVP
jgi:hypothetical protein